MSPFWPLSTLRPRMTMLFTIPPLRKPRSTTVMPYMARNTSNWVTACSVSRASPDIAEMLYGMSVTVVARRVAVTMISSICPSSVSCAGAGPAIAAHAVATAATSGLRLNLLLSSIIAPQSDITF
jgi:hypothetical protein